MSASSIKRKSTLLLREATRSFIFRSATTFPGRKHLRENAFLGFRFEMKNKHEGIVIHDIAIGYYKNKQGEISPAFSFEMMEIFLL